MHIHVSGIAYGKKGEIKHLNLKESDLQYVELLKALKDYEARGLVICESPDLEEDALLLQETYHKL
jgi:deoxyribonuclease-4